MLVFVKEFQDRLNMFDFLATYFAVKDLFHLPLDDYDESMKYLDWKK